MKLSVIIPVYNEAETIVEIIRKVKAVPLDKEIIVVNDCSLDGTEEILANISDLKIIKHEKNRGKGAAIRTGLKEVSGDIVIIQDADLEYEPNDYLKLIVPIESGQTEVVYGSRNLAINKSGKKIYKWGGIFLSRLANFLYGLNITDEATGYKVFKTKLLKNLDLKCERFDFCPEVTAKLGRNKYKIIEVPISYNPRSRVQGKKIQLSDGLKAAWLLIKYKFFHENNWR